MTNGRAKGKRAEREVVHMIRPWWATREPDVEFVRTPLSGGWSTESVRGRFRAAGDIMTTSDKWPFVVEVKRREAFSLGAFVDGRASVVWGWWRQSVKDAATLDAAPMLWFRKSTTARKRPFPWIVLVPERYASCFLSDVAFDIRFPETLNRDDGGVRPVGLTADKFLALEPFRFERMKYKDTRT